MNDIREDLKAFVDGELTESRRLEVDAAIQADPKLAEEVRLLKLLGGEIKEIAAEAPIAGATETIAKLRKPKRSLVQFLASPFGSLSAAAAVVVCIVSVAKFPTGNNAAEAAMSELTTSSPANIYAPSTTFDTEGTEAEVSRPPVMQEKAPNMGFDEDKTARQNLAKSTSGVGSSAAKGVPLETYNRTIDNNGQIGSGQANQVYKQPKLVRKADLSVRVPSVHEGQAKASEIAKKLNGFVENTSLNATESGSEASLAVRVPVENFEAALIEFRAMGTVVAENSSSEDVTAPLANDESRIVTLADTEKNLINELAKSKDANMKYRIRRDLERVRGELAAVKAQYKALREIADYSTISLKLVGRPQGEKDGDAWSSDTWTNATNSARSMGRVFGAMGMYLVAYAPMWIPLGIIVWLIARKRVR